MRLYSPYSLNHAVRLLGVEIELAGFVSLNRSKISRFVFLQKTPCGKRGHERSTQKSEIKTNVTSNSFFWPRAPSVISQLQLEELKLRLTFWCITILFVALLVAMKSSNMPKILSIF